MRSVRGVVLGSGVPSVRSGALDDAAGLMSSAFPIADDVLVEKVRALAGECGTWPSQRMVMRACRVGAPRADAALAALRSDGFDPGPELGQEQPVEAGRQALDTALYETIQATTEAADTAAEALVSAVEDAVAPGRVRGVPRWPLLVIASGAFVAIWSGWVGLGKLTGFGPVVLLPGIANEWVIDSAITLPLGVEAYAAFALLVWLSDAPVRSRARAFARWSALGSLVLGASGQVAYHLLTAAGVTTAPWQITTFVSCLPVVVLGCGAALVHLIHQEAR